MVSSASGLVGRFDGTRLRVHAIGAEIEALIENSEGQIWGVARDGLYRISAASSSDPTPEERIDPALRERRAKAYRYLRRVAGIAVPSASGSAAPDAWLVSVGGNDLLLSKGRNGNVWLSMIEPLKREQFSISFRDSRGSLWAWQSGRGLGSNGRGGRTLGGGLGFGLLGTIAAQSSRNVGAALGYYGLGWSLYSTVVARGAEVQFNRNAVVDIGFNTRSPVGAMKHNNDIPAAKGKVMAPLSFNTWTTCRIDI